MTPIQKFIAQHPQKRDGETIMARMRAASTLAHLPDSFQQIARFEVVTGRGRVVADFTADTGPYGCGVVTRVLRQVGKVAFMGHAGSIGVPSACPRSVLIGLARRQADNWARSVGKRAKVRRRDGEALS